MIREIIDLAILRKNNAPIYEQIRLIKKVQFRQQIKDFEKNANFKLLNIMRKQFEDSIGNGVISYYSIRSSFGQTDKAYDDSMKFIIDNYFKEAIAEYKDINIPDSLYVDEFIHKKTGEYIHIDIYRGKVKIEMRMPFRIITFESTSLHDPEFVNYSICLG